MTTVEEANQARLKAVNAAADAAVLVRRRTIELEMAAQVDASRPTPETEAVVLSGREALAIAQSRKDVAQRTLADAEKALEDVKMVADQIARRELGERRARLRAELSVEMARAVESVGATITACRAVLAAEAAIQATGEYVNDSTARFGYELEQIVGNTRFAFRADAFSLADTLLSAARLRP